MPRRCRGSRAVPAAFVPILLPWMTTPGVSETSDGERVAVRIGLAIRDEVAGSRCADDGARAGADNLDAAVSDVGDILADVLEPDRPGGIGADVVVQNLVATSTEYRLR